MKTTLAPRKQASNGSGDTPNRPVKTVGVSTLNGLVSNDQGKVETHTELFSTSENLDSFPNIDQSPFPRIHNIKFTTSMVRKRLSAETQLIPAVHDWASTIVVKVLINVFVFDFCMAFDTMLHRSLITNLHHYGIDGKTSNWTASLLRGQDNGWLSTELVRPGHHWSRASLRAQSSGPYYSTSTSTASISTIHFWSNEYQMLLKPEEVLRSFHQQHVQN